MLALVTKYGNRGIQFLQEKLLKNFYAMCIYAISVVLPKGRQMLSTMVMVQITSSAKKHLRIALALLKWQIQRIYSKNTYKSLDECRRM